MWFERLMGFQEKSPEYVRENILLNGTVLKSLKNGAEFACGTLDIPSLRELRNAILADSTTSDESLVREVVANVQDLYVDEANAGALFQVASQFNLLEMVSPSVTPERGIDGYESDFTQGPASAIAAGAGTIYRNYFVEVNGRTGQSSDNQVDCLNALGEAFANELGVTLDTLWEMRNGYALLFEDGLTKIDDMLNDCPESTRDEFRALLRIGVQYDVSVTIGDSAHKVSQAYCSALPVSYCAHSSDMIWESFARLILEAAYEATFNAALLNFKSTGNNKLFLTLLGGGAFGNKKIWIIDAIDRAFRLHRNSGLDVVVVSYGSADALVGELVKSLATKEM